MPFIRQEDIVDGLFSKDVVDTYKINPDAELEGAIVADPYALGFGLGRTSPLQIKQTNPGTNKEWADEQDITFHNQDFVEDGPFYDVNSGAGTFITLPGASYDMGDTALAAIFGGPGVWASVGAGSALNTNRANHGAAGTLHSMLVAGGINTAATVITSTEFFNGSVFSATGNLAIAKTEGFSLGSSYAMLFGAGINGAATYVSNTTFFNGNSWVAGTVGPAEEVGMSAFGSFNSAYLKSGKTAGATYSNNFYYFNGETWSAAGIPATSAGLQTAYSSACGSSNNGVIVGGLNGGGNVSNTNTFNGISFILGSNLLGGLNKSAMSGIGTSAILAGGDNGALLTTTQLYNGLSWSAAANTNISRAGHSSGGSVINNVIAGNTNTGATNVCETYNQSTYRKLNPYYVNTAGNIGTIYNTNVLGANKCSIKMSGILHGVPAGTSFGYLIIARYTDYGGGVVNFQETSNAPSSDDYVYAKYDAVNTKLHTFQNFNKTYNIVKKWG